MTIVELEGDPAADAPRTAPMARSTSLLALESPATSVFRER